MNEYVVPSFVRDKSISLLVVEPLYCTLHVKYLQKNNICLSLSKAWDYGNIYC